MLFDSVSFFMLSAKQENYMYTGTIFIVFGMTRTWLEIDPGASSTLSQHSTPYLWTQHRLEAYLWLFIVTYAIITDTSHLINSTFNCNVVWMYSTITDSPFSLTCINSYCIPRYEFTSVWSMFLYNTQLNLWNTNHVQGNTCR